MTTLDEIQARADETKAKARWAGTKPSPAHEDRNKLLAALRAVEEVHSRIPCGLDEYIPFCRACSAEDAVAWPCPTIRAIREALG